MANLERKPLWKQWWLWAIFVCILMLIAFSGGSDNKQAIAPVSYQNNEEAVKSELKRVLINKENKDKTCVAYKIAEVKNVGTGEYVVTIYSDLGEDTNYSGNTFQMLAYMNDLAQERNIVFYNTFIQYFKKIDGESIRVCTYQVGKNDVRPILEYGQKEGNPLADLKKIDGTTKESDL